MRYFYILLIFSLLFFNGCSTCDDIITHVKGLKYRFKVTEKSKSQYINFKGYDSLNRKIEFREGEYWGIYNFIEIGDTLFKELGKTELVLIKKDTTLVFPLKCRGKVMEY